MISWERNRATLPAALIRLAASAGDAASSTAFPTSHGFGQQAASTTPSASAARMSDDRRLTFEQAHTKYHLKIYNLIYKWVGNQDDAEDLTAITFTNAWKAWGRFRGDAQVSTWLYQIAHNNYKNYCTQQARKRQYEGMSLDEGVDTGSGEGEIGREVADWSAVPEEVLLSSEFAIARPKIYRRAFAGVSRGFSPRRAGRNVLRGHRAHHGFDRTERQNAPSSRPAAASAAFGAVLPRVGARRKQ